MKILVLGHSGSEGGQPFATGTASLNFLGIEDAEKHTVSRAFEPETFARLLEVKASYDPENVFRLNHNIR